MSFAFKSASHLIMGTHSQTFITGVAHCTVNSFIANLLSMFEAKLLAENTLFIGIQFIYAHYFQRRANLVPILNYMLQSLCKPPVSLTPDFIQTNCARHGNGLLPGS
jgi:hypothetical protein